MCKALRRNREFSLKNCHRIHVSGSCKPNPDRKTTRGTVQVDAVSPSVSFQAVPIRPVPLLHTPLFQALTRCDQLLSAGVGGAVSPTSTGYLTLNQTRKAVFMAETDGALSNTPTVGLWVRFTGLSPGSESLVDHPYCWGACVRYLSSDWLQHREFMGDETFLLVSHSGELTSGAHVLLQVVILAEQQVEFFEVTRTAACRGEQLVPYSPDTFLSPESDFVLSSASADVATTVSLEQSQGASKFMCTAFFEVS